jgi:hypothetical protein
MTKKIVNNKSEKKNNLYVNGLCRSQLNFMRLDVFLHPSSSKQSEKESIHYCAEGIHERDLWVNRP